MPLHKLAIYSLFRNLRKKSIYMIIATSAVIFGAIQLSSGTYSVLLSAIAMLIGCCVVTACGIYHMNKTTYSVLKELGYNKLYIYRNYILEMIIIYSLSLAIGIVLFKFFCPYEI